MLTNCPSSQETCSTSLEKYVNLCACYFTESEWLPTIHKLVLNGMYRNRTLEAFECMTMVHDNGFGYAYLA